MFAPALPTGSRSCGGGTGVSATMNNVSTCQMRSGGSRSVQARHTLHSFTQNSCHRDCDSSN